MQLKDRERKKAAYTSVNQMSEKEVSEKRKRWRTAKKPQRLAKGRMVKAMHVSRPDQAEDCPQRKKLKQMTVEERREYNRQRQRESRARRTKQKKVYDRKKDKTRKKEKKEPTTCSTTKTSAEKKGSSRATLCRKAKDVRDQIPQSPKSYAKIIEKVVANSTPRKRAELEKRGLKRNLDGTMSALTSSIQAEVKELREQPMTEERRQRYKFLANTVCRTTMKYPKVQKKVAALLGLGRKVIRRKVISRKPRRDILSHETKVLVHNYWMSEEVSREVPLKKRVKKGEPPFLLNCSYVEAYQRFRSSYPGVKVGYCKFVECRPKNVMLMKALEGIVCCCIKCENVKLKLQALNQQVAKMKKPYIRIRHVDDLASKTICPPVNGQVSMKCLKRKCSHCGVDAIQQHYLPLVQACKEDHMNGMKFDEWKSIAQEIPVKPNGVDGDEQTRKVKRLRRVTSSATDVEEVINHLKGDMMMYPAHKFRANWQKAQFDNLKTNMPPQSAVLVMDFAMNYTCFLQDEVQSYHWSPPQVTIHPCFTYINVSEEFSSPTHTEAIIIISSDLQHDAAAVAKFLSTCSEHLKKSYPGITHMFQFSDCCASQYRCSTSFADVSFSQEDLGLKVQRHYFESSHGKSPADGQGAVVKRAATMAVTRREANIRSAEEFFQFCQEKLTDVGQGVYPSRQKEYQNAKRSFIFLKSEDIHRNRPERYVKTVIGTMSIHAIKASGSPYNIQARDLSCFCSRLSEEGECKNADVVGCWRNVQLTPKLSSVVWRVMASTPNEADGKESHVINEVGDGDGCSRELANANQTKQTLPPISVDSWVAVIYDGEWWPGVVEEVDYENESSYHIKFMKPSCPGTQNRFVWPLNKDEIDCLPRDEILTIIGEPPRPLPGDIIA